MKILYVTTISSTVNSFLIPHIQMLIERGHKVDIACKFTKPLSEELTTLYNCKTFNIGFHRSPFHKGNIKAHKDIKRIVEAEDYDIVHTHTPIASFITRLAIRNMNNIKVLYTAHGFHFFKGAPLKNWLIYYPLEKIAAKWTDGLITMNEEDYLNATKMKFRKSNAVFKINGVGVNLEKFTPQNDREKLKLRKEYNFNDNDFILIYVASLDANKNQNLLINTIKMLRENIPNIKLILAGDGPLKSEYEKIINSLNMNDTVYLLGMRNDINSLLKISDIAVASSKREGLPVNIMEAMATGLPIVATEKRGHKDLISDGINGILINDYSPEKFAKAILTIKNTETIKMKFKENSLNKIKFYTIPSVIKELEKVYSYYIK